MVTLAPQLRLLAFLLTNFAAVFAPLPAFGDHAGAGGMRAFLGASHFTPPGTVLSCATATPFSSTQMAEGTLRYTTRTARALVLILPTFGRTGGNCVAHYLIQMSCARRLAALDDIHAL